MKSDFKSIFNFNRIERTGITVVILIIILVLCFPFFIKIAIPDQKQDFALFLKDIERFEASRKASIDSIKLARELDFQQMDRSVAQLKLNPFPFNPNLLPSEQWSKLGLKDWQIKMIKKFEAKGGKFRNKEDFRKMFCITPSEYDQLEPFIKIPEQQSEFVSKSAEKKPWIEKEKVLIDINTADTAALISLYGIGPSFARRIVKYRNLLGGFYSKNQLTEVFGFDQDKLDKIEKYITVNPGDIKKININTVTTEVLKKHPYFDYYTAKAIVDKRIAKGKYTSLDQLKDLPLIHDELFAKIINYLTIE